METVSRKGNKENINNNNNNNNNNNSENDPLSYQATKAVAKKAQ